jgi:hypothetical protein
MRACWILRPGFAAKHVALHQSQGIGIIVPCRLFGIGVSFVYSIPDAMFLLLPRIRQPMAAYVFKMHAHDWL